MAEFVRCVRTKMCEAIRLIYLADPLVQSYWKNRVSIERQNVQDGVVITPQIVVVPAPLAFEPGVTGVTHRTRLAIRVGMFEPFRREPEKLGEPKAECKLAHLEYLIARGSPGDADMPGTEGQIIDPDNPRSPDSSQRFLNTTDPDFIEQETLELFDPNAKIVGDKRPDPIALVYPVIVVFETNLDNVTQQRR